MNGWILFFYALFCANFLIMEQDDFWKDDPELLDIINQYQNLRAGKSFKFLDAEAYERIIDYYDDIDEMQHALEAVITALEYFPYNPELLIKKADVLIYKRRYLEALQILDDVAAIDANNIDIYILKTEAYLALDRQAEAASLLEESLCLFEDSERIDLLFELADVYDDYEDFNNVFNCLQLILKEDSTNEEALYKICFWTDFTGRYDESIALYQDIINLHPYNELAWFNLANAYQSLKLFEKAIDTYKYCIAIDEKFEFAYRNMGDALIRLNKYRDAIEILEKLSEISRPDEILYEAIGYCYYKINNYAQARFNYRKASHINQHDSRLHYKIALTYMQEDKYVPAIQQLEISLRIHNGEAEYHIALGECLLQQNRQKEAFQHLGHAVRIKPKKISGWESLIKALYYADQFQEALKQCQAALIATSNKAIFHYYHGACSFAAGKQKEGLISLEIGLKTQPQMVKKFFELNPQLFKYPLVVDLVARYKKLKKLRKPKAK